MNVIMLIGDQAVGKMTVGQHLADYTGYGLMYNHLTIEPVLSIFNEYRWDVINDIRKLLYNRILRSNITGLIVTQNCQFDNEGIMDYFDDTIYKLSDNNRNKLYFVELIASLETRLKRNTTENRLVHKPSKRDIEASKASLLHYYNDHRCISYEGEFHYKPYLRINNENISAEETAKQIIKYFNLERSCK